MLEFRLTGQLSGHGVSIAVLTGPDLNSRNNVAVADLAHTISENLVSHTGTPFTVAASTELINDGTTTKLGFVMSDNIVSSKLIVTNRASLRTGGRPGPLFYKYGIGRGAYGIYAVPETDVTTDDYASFLSYLTNGETMPDNLRYLLALVSEAIQNSIAIQIRGKGATRMSWDIDGIRPMVVDKASQFYGKVFTANIYTARRNGRGLTYILTYNAYDPGLVQVITGKREVLNAVPVAEVVSSDVIDEPDRGGKIVSVKVALNERLAKVLN